MARMSTLSEKKCWNYVDFPHILRFSYFSHRIEVDNCCHIFMCLIVIVLMCIILLEKILLNVCGISNACLSMWRIYSYTIISLVECIAAPKPSNVISPQIDFPKRDSLNHQPANIGINAWSKTMKIRKLPWVFVFWSELFWQIHELSCSDKILQALLGLFLAYLKSIPRIFQVRNGH